MGGYVDLHAHHLPALDDGARDEEMSRRMVAAVASLGFSTLNATPHQRANKFMPARDAIDGAYAKLADELRAGSPALEFGLAAENFWDEVFLTRLRDGGLPCYPGGRAFLFEIDPRLLPPRFEQVLFEIRVGGRLPVLAHPERYVGLQQDLARAEAIGRSVAMVVDLGALDGAHGRAEMKTARRLVEEGIAHAAATDIHSPEDQRAIAAGMAWIRGRLGQATLDRLLGENPRRILAGELP